MSTTEEGFSSELKVMSATKFGCVGLDRESDPSARQAFFERNESIAIYLDRCLLYLSQNLNFKLVAISSSSSSSQIIGGISHFTPTSTSSLEYEENREDEDEVARGEVLAFWMGRVIDIFFWVGEWTVEVDIGWLATEACFSIPFWHFFSRFSRQAWRASESAKLATS